MSRRVAYTKWQEAHKQAGELTQRVLDLTASLEIVNSRAAERARDDQGALDRCRAVIEEQHAQIEVLSSDRDRLTTVVEVLSRRIVSPRAETDARRAGWRHNRYAAGEAQTVNQAEQKATDRRG